MNKHNHFTTSYYLMLKKYNNSNGKMDLELSESSLDQVGRKTTYAGNFTKHNRGKSVQDNNNSNKAKIDPFAHLTPVARQFIENSELISNRGYNNTKRMNSTEEGQKIKQIVNSPNQKFENSDASYSPRRGNLQPSGNYNAKFATTVVGSFRNKAGYSAPEHKKRDLGYVNVAKGPLFNPRGGTANGSIIYTNSTQRRSPSSNNDKRSTSYNTKVKAPFQTFQNKEFR